MEKIVVEGGHSLKGDVLISGAKNAVLPILAACLLTSADCILEDVPWLADVETICLLLKSLGGKITRAGKQVVVNCAGAQSTEAPYEYVRQMRASFLVAGPLLARSGRAKVALPGGCAIGARPLDLHLKGFVSLGARVELGQGVIEMEAPSLKGAEIYLDFPSVGATENLVMAASLAQGITVIENAALEPEIVDLANFLNALGARITGAGTRTIRIEGVKELRGACHQVIPDRIEAGTFMIAAVATGGEVLVKNVITSHLRPLVAKLAEIGAEVREVESNLLWVKGNYPLKAVDVKTLPYPGFPTDLQPQMIALLARAEGTSIVTETVFENRFLHVYELRRLGARIYLEGHSAVIEGVPRLGGAPVKATDLRAGAALVIAGLMAEGETEISCAHHLDRGYENLKRKLQGLGAKIKRIPASSSLDGY